MKRIIKDLLITIIVLGVVSGLLILASNNFDKKAKKCDEAYGYTCSYYQVKNFRGWFYDCTKKEDSSRHAKIFIVNKIYS